MKPKLIHPEEPKNKRGGYMKVLHEKRDDFENRITALETTAKVDKRQLFYITLLWIMFILIAILYADRLGLYNL